MMALFYLYYTKIVKTGFMTVFDLLHKIELTSLRVDNQEYALQMS